MKSEMARGQGLSWVGIDDDKVAGGARQGRKTSLASVIVFHANHARPRPCPLSVNAACTVVAARSQHVISTQALALALAR